MIDRETFTIALNRMVKQAGHYYIDDPKNDICYSYRKDLNVIQAVYDEYEMLLQENERLNLKLGSIALNDILGVKEVYEKYKEKVKC